MAASELFSTSFFSDANLKAYWRFNSGDLTDSIGSVAMVADGSGSTSDSGGKFGFGRKHDGLSSSSTTHINYAATFALPSMKTISFWAKASSNPGSIKIAADNANVTSGASNFFRLNFNNGPVASFNIAASAGNSHDTGNISTDLNWHHYAITHNGNINNSHLYYDGAEVTGTGGSTNSVIGDNSTNVFFGARFDGAVPADFTLDDLAIFDRQLSATEINTIANGTATSSPITRRRMMVGFGS